MAFNECKEFPVESSSLKEVRNFAREVLAKEPVFETSNDDIDVETSSEDDGPAEAATEKDTILQIIEYNDYRIGICQDTGYIHEKDESDGEWYRTKLVWDYEKACPRGF